MVSGSEPKLVSLEELSSKILSVVAGADQGSVYGPIYQSYLELREKEDTKASTAADTLLQELDTMGKAEGFFKWMRKKAKTRPHFDRNCLKESQHDDTADWIRKANWKTGEKALTVLNARLCYSDRDTVEDYLPIGKLKNHWLGLRKHNKAMIPPRTNPAFLEHHQVTVVNSNTVLRLQYQRLPNNGSIMLTFAQVGIIMSSPIPTQHLDGSASLALTWHDITTEGPWHDTGFVLGLLISSSGEGGAYYMIRNTTSEDDWEQMLEETVKNVDDARIELCAGAPAFTVARIKGRNDFFLKVDEICWLEEDLELEVLSERRSQVVQTGFVKDGKDGKDRRLIALWGIVDLETVDGILVHNKTD